ncbi:hypothetical protein BDD43_4271 [Mucilaginibacter gracilis]|uniref:Uncharacterized protein n=1 Tax=Mucilaginibacter gracilis TaxID=423350 RepID=A0A495J4Z6_9SPHI|nr:hypothetical protein [Mucilaginibacter gracilis]RKR84050.1 hypothetical protein BDD43_4271 [Mucilaginibacter gracilis]
MINQETKTISYFRATAGYFWKWADNGSVVEFANGRTICYQEDLNFILEALELSRDIHLGTVLLVLCACKDNYETLFEPEVHLRPLGYRPGYLEAEHLLAKQLVQQALDLMKLVNALPFSYRSGISRVALCQAVLAGKENSDVRPLKSLLQTFRSGALDDAIFNKNFDFGFTVLQSDLMPLASALDELKNTAALEMKLRTGMAEIPAPVDIPLPAPVPDELMAQLESDIKTVGLARLAKRITAALNIPMHLAGSSDQSIGGVSDISNRGHFDKLLLSELAQDDLLLTARLANNEALFLQREELPNNVHQEWHVLLDTTLKMWGTPRVFALASALAFSENRKQDRMKAWALGGKGYGPMDLTSKEGIISTLEKLDPALGCGPQLKKLMAEQAAPQGKYILITGGQYRLDAEFQQAFATIRDQLDYLVEVGRDGQITMFETRGKKHKIVNRALIDLEETLWNRRSTILQKRNMAGLPAMLQQTEFPLLFPASKIKFKHDSIFKCGTGQTIIITQDRRVLYWTIKDEGGRELIEQIEPGDSFWGESPRYVYLLIRNLQEAYVKIYQVDMANISIMVHNIEKIKAQEVRFAKGLFYITRENDVILVDPQSGHTKPADLGRKDVKTLQVTAHFQVLNQIKKLVNNGYSVINSAKNIYVHTAGKIFIDQRELNLAANDRHLSWKENSLAAVQWVKPLKQENIELAHLPYLKFTKFSWADGSEAVLDSRGLLHLKSADANIAECSVILVVDQPTACWSADGKITGSPYFTGNRQAGVMLAGDFYRDYIDSFIKRLK